MMREELILSTRSICKLPIANLNDPLLPPREGEFSSLTTLKVLGWAYNLKSWACYLRESVLMVESLTIITCLLPESVSFISYSVAVLIARLQETIL